MTALILVVCVLLCRDTVEARSGGKRTKRLIRSSKKVMDMQIAQGYQLVDADRRQVDVVSQMEEIKQLFKDYQESLAAIEVRIAKNKDRISDMGDELGERVFG